MSEVVPIFVGKSACRLGSYIYDSLCHEHGIQWDGTLMPTLVKPAQQQQQTHLTAPVALNNVFFHEKNNTKKKSFSARALFVHGSPLTRQNYRLFDPEFVLTTSSLTISDCVRRLVEKCDHVQGFVVANDVHDDETHFLESASLLESLSDEFAKQVKLAYTVFPSPEDTHDLFYDALLYSHYVLSSGSHTFSVLFDMQSMRYLWQEKIYDLRRPVKFDAHALMARVFCQLTASMRFACELTVNLNDLYTNLVPYERLQFLLSSCVLPLVKTKQDSLASKTQEMTALAFHPAYQLMCVNTKSASSCYLSCALLYQGQRVSVSSVNDSIERVKRHARFSDSVPSSFLVGLCSAKPQCWERSVTAAAAAECVCMVANSTAMQTCFMGIGERAAAGVAASRQQSHNKETLIEDELFEEAREDLAKLERDYDMIELSARVSDIRQMQSERRKAFPSFETSYEK